MTITSQQQKTLIETLKNRFDKHMNRHADIDWMQVQHKLEANSKKMWSLNEMEQTGGEPDVVGFDEQTGEFIFYDCSAESPSGRRSTCYDKKGLESRKQHIPDHNAIDLATEMGIELLTVEQYHKLQTFGEFDTKTSSWLQTPKEVRQLGGALFGDYRYGKVFIYHNGAQTYYAARGFRGALKV